MGCDVHIWVEIRDEKYVTRDGKEVVEPCWRMVMHDLATYGERNYALFARLAGVRNAREDDPRHIQPICKPRGAPADASVPTDDFADDVDLHSHTWFTVKELVELPGPVPEYMERFNLWVHTLFGEGARAAMHGTLSVFGPADVRLLIAFDN